MISTRQRFVSVIASLLGLLIELPFFGTADERGPLLAAEPQYRPARILRVTNGHDARQVVGHLDAVGLVSAACGLAPVGAGQVHPAPPFCAQVVRSLMMRCSNPRD